MKRRKRMVICLLGIIFTVLLIWTLWSNTALEMNTVTVAEDDLPESFDGFRIAHVSDLHSAEMGKGNAKLLEMLRSAKPDIIAITGDLMDCRDTAPDIALSFAAEAAQIAPTFYVTGNHEARLEQSLYDSLLTGLRDAGVTVLLDEEQLFSRGDEAISIAGHGWGDTDRIGEISDFDGYRILLSHHPENFSVYAAAAYDLVLCGHAHGGQIRLPFIGGLFAPGQGFFPKYDSGLYSSGNTDMIVSRGIGNSSFPLRINNRPEVVLVVLEG